ncbi:hypothetical protein KEM55_008598 [Ascosphaera atra]|nr:hypothetical protein KEM55_008598 [Ascosphaera atra]
MSKSSRTNGAGHRRVQLLQMLQDTECDYLFDLEAVQYLKERLQAPYKVKELKERFNMAEPTELLKETGGLSQEDINEAFGDVDGLFNFAHRFKTELYRRKPHNPKADWGALFLEHEKGFISYYEPFIIRQLRPDRRRSSLRRKMLEALKAPFLEETFYDKESMSDLFNKPLQRVVEYQQILRTIEPLLKDAELKKRVARAAEMFEGIMSRVKEKVGKERVKRALAGNFNHIDGDMSALKLS